MSSMMLTREGNHPATSNVQAEKQDIGLGVVEQYNQLSLRVIGIEDNGIWVKPPEVLNKVADPSVDPDQA